MYGDEALGSSLALLDTMKQRQWIRGMIVWVRPCVRPWIRGMSVWVRPCMRSCIREMSVWVLARSLLALHYCSGIIRGTPVECKGDQSPEHMHNSTQSGKRLYSTWPCLCNSSSDLGSLCYVFILSREVCSIIECRSLRIHLTNVTLLCSNIRVSNATLNTLQNTLIRKNSATEEALQRFICHLFTKKNINFFLVGLCFFVFCTLKQHFLIAS